MIYDPNYFDCLKCHGNGCDICGGTGKSNVPVNPNCSNEINNTGNNSCSNDLPTLLYTSNIKTELPKERFKLSDCNLRSITHFKCFSSPTGLIIELPKQELFPPYKVELLNPNEL